MTMTDINEEIVRIRAYHIWEREGRPEGREAEHWHAALRELVLEAKSGNGVSAKPAAKAKTAPASVKSPRKGRIGSIAAKAKDALDGTAEIKPAVRKRKPSTKGDADSGKRSPKAP